MLTGSELKPLTVLASCLLIALSAAVAQQAPEAFQARRQRMVESQILQRGISEPGVLRAMRTVPRHLFVAPGVRDRAYEDRALPIGEAQTIPQP